MTSLIDRYVLTALRRVPEEQRADIDRELRASIEDAVDARVDEGAPRDAAVQAALLELGDPDRLADSYAGRRGYLIGPELFPVWRRLLKLLYTAVLPIVVVFVVIVQLLDDPDAGRAIGAGISALITTGVHMAFWTTLVFAIIERTGAPAELTRPWKPDDLPRHDVSEVDRGQLVGALVWPVLLIAALVLQQFTFTRVPVLDPAGWHFWWPFFIAMLLVKCGYQFWLLRRAAWTHTVTLVNAVIVVVTTVPLVWLLASHHVFNPDLITDSTLVTAISIVVVVAGALWDIAEVAIKAQRAG
jgi:hypothetical protein